MRTGKFYAEEITTVGENEYMITLVVDPVEKVKPISKDSNIHSSLFDTLSNVYFRAMVILRILFISMFETQKIFSCLLK